MSFSTSLLNFIQIGPPSAEKMTSCRFSRWRISAILDFRGPIMGSLKSPCTTSYRSSIDTIALNCLVYEKIAFLHFGVKIQDGGSHNINLRPSIRLLSLYNTCIIRRTDRRTDGRTKGYDRLRPVVGRRVLAPRPADNTRNYARQRPSALGSF